MKTAMALACMAAWVGAANLDRLTWAPGSSGREWDVPQNWAGTSGEYPNELHEEAYFSSAALQPLLDRDIAQLGRLTFATAGWIIEQEGTNQYTITFYHTSNDYNAIYSAGSGTNIILAGVAFNVNGQNLYSAANNVLVVRRVVGPNGCVMSSTTPAQDNPGEIVLDGNNSGVTQPFVLRQGTLVVAHPNALGSSSQTLYVGDNWTATNARARLLAGTNGLTLNKPIEVRNRPGLSATLGCAAGVTSVTVSGALTLQRATTFAGPSNATLLISGAIGGPGGVVISNAGMVVVSHPGNSYTGGTTVVLSAVRVVTNHALGSGPVVLTNAVCELRGNASISNEVIAGNSVVRGDGTVAGLLWMQPGSTLAPGLSVGRITAGTLLMASNSTYVVEIAGASPGMYDSVALATSGMIVYATLQPQLQYEPAYGDVLTLIEVEGAGELSGAFAGYAEGGYVALPSGLQSYVFRVTYMGGAGSNDMQLICVPEAGGLGLVALLTWVMWPRRRSMNEDVAR